MTQSKKTAVKRRAYARTTAPSKTMPRTTRTSSRSFLTDAYTLLVKSALPATVFLTGAAVLIMEIVAVRLFSPYFGNTMYSVSSVISVVLAALSVGYVAGGRLADKRPRVDLFYGIIGVSGVLVLLLQALSKVVLPEIGFKLSVVSGPLIVSFLFLFLPSFLMGMLSPFAVKLQTVRLPDTGIGHVAGNIFFWSTLGSIAGSLSTGFILIPLFGLHTILSATGIGLLLLAFIPLNLRRLRKASIVMLAIGIGLMSVSTPARANVVYEADGQYERITIYDGTARGRPVRFFQQDRSSSGAMYLDGDDLVYDYTKYYSLYKLSNPNAKNALVIGGGAYSIPKALLNELPADGKVDVSEIEPSLIDLGKKYFNVPDDARLRNFTTDGRRLLHDSDTSYDIIYSDVYYSLYSIPTHFTTKEFFEAAKDKLNKNGIFIGNLIGDFSRDDKSFSLSELKTFQEVFPNNYVFGVQTLASENAQNTIFVGVKSDMPLDLTPQNLRRFADPVLQGLSSRLIDPRRFELSSYSVIRDNYAPVDSLTAALLSRSFEDNFDHLKGWVMYNLIAQQLRYGSRAPGQSGHDKVVDFIESELKAYTPTVIRQQFPASLAAGGQLTNIIGRFNPNAAQRVIVATHFDTKRYSDHDKESPDNPVPGANDGASGTAVLLELARILAANPAAVSVGVDLVFFDGEEGVADLDKDLNGWQPLGSTYFASHLSDMYDTTLPTQAIVLDMVCEKNLRLNRETQSLQKAAAQAELFWAIGAKKDAQAFDTTRAPQTIGDDHSPLNAAGIPSFLVIDRDYPHWHTTQDTLDKCNPDSLELVGNTTYDYLKAL